MVRKTFWNNTIIRCFGDCNCVFNSYFRIELICIRQTVIMLTIIPAIILIGAALKYRVNKIHNNINIHIYAKISSISIYITCVTNQSTGRFPPVILAFGGENLTCSLVTETINSKVITTLLSGGNNEFKYCFHIRPESIRKTTTGGRPLG